MILKNLEVIYCHKPLIVVGNTSAELLVAVKDIGNDLTLDCPTIKYDNSDSRNIKINIILSSSIKSYNVDVSVNGYTGSSAKWQNYVTSKTSESTFNLPYTYGQARITIFDKDGNSRYCYTVPFDFDKGKNSNTQIKFTNSLVCPKITQKSVEKVNGTNQYTIHQFGDEYALHTGIRKVFLNIDAKSKDGTQYTWLTNQDTYYLGYYSDVK